MVQVVISYEYCVYELTFTTSFNGPPSVFSENIIRLKSMFADPLALDLSPLLHITSLLSGEVVTVILSVILLHFAGFFVG